MTNFRLLWCALGAMILLTGCPDADLVDRPRCDAARRCVSGDVQVCGEDGQSYECAALARCEGVIVDPTGRACMGQEEDPVCQPVACRLFCSEGFATGEDGCEICACKEPEEIICPPIAPPDCSDSDERLVCDADDVCGTSCRCEPLGKACPEPEEPAACPGFAEVECGDFDGDGCQECRCEDVFMCPPEDGGSCDEGFSRICRDQDGDGCEECECERDPECPAPPVPQCPPNTEPVLKGSPCGQWSCEPVECLDVDIDCAPLGEELMCAYNAQGCEACWCEPGWCPGNNRPECFGTERVTGIDDRGCTMFACDEPPVCDAVECLLACEHGFEIDEDGCEVCVCAQPESCGINEECDQDEMCLDAGGRECCPWGSECEICQGTCQRVPRCERDQDCAPGDECQETIRQDCCPSFATCDANIPLCISQCVDPR